MKNLFSIGELSKLQNISRQTLIFYDEIGADGYSKDAADCVKLVSRLLS